MKFSVNVAVTTPKKGLELDSEYDRLGFEEESRGEIFRAHRGMPVSKDWAKKHKDLFKYTNVVTITVDISHVNSGDFEEWGTAGTVLGDMEHERIDALLPNAQVIR